MRAITVLLGGVLLCALAGAARGQDGAPATPLTLLDADGRRPVPTRIVDGREMIALDDIAGLFGVTVREDVLVGGVTVTVNGRTIAVAAGQTTVSVGGRLVALPAPLTRVDGRWLVPIEFLSRALAPVADTLIDLRPASRLLIVGDLTVPRVTARIEAGGPPTRATLDLTPAARVTPTVEAGRIVLRIDAAGLDLAGGPLAGAGLITGIELADATTLVVRFSPDAAAPIVTPSVVDGAARVLIEVPAAAAAAAPGPFPAPPPAPGAAPGLGLARRAAIDVIVIDPGHGGDDTGVRGPSGTLEKTVTLAVAQQLQTLIETRLGARVLLTRDADRTVPLDQRTALANSNKADLFLSLHAGGAPSAAVAGAEVLVVRLGREGEDARRSAVANAAVLPVLGGGSRAIEVIRWDLAQAPHVETSDALAGILEAEIGRRARLGPRPRRDAPLRLLMGANMPAAMIELGYLTNPEEEQLLGAGPYQAALAEALFDAVVRFRGYLDARGAE